MSAHFQIVGGGLTGLSLGTQLALHGFPVQVDEASDYPRHRVCGECLTGLKARTVRALGLAPLLHDAPAIQQVAWKHGERTVTRKRLPAPAPGISRWSLDQRLAEAFEAAGGTLRRNRRVARPGGIAGPGDIDTAGRQRARPDRPRWIGLKLHAIGLSLEADLTVYLTRGGYLGLSRVENDRANLCGLFPADTFSEPRQWHRQLAALGLPELASMLQSAEIDPASVCAVAGLDYAPSPRSPGMVQLGDAAGLIPPFTGHGMALAFESAEVALPHLLAYGEERISWETAVHRIQRTLHRTFQRRQTIARGLQPWLTHPRRQAVLALFARSGLLPFRFLYRCTHGAAAS